MESAYLWSIDRHWKREGKISVVIHEPGDMHGTYMIGRRRIAAVYFIAEKRTAVKWEIQFSCSFLFRPKPGANRCSQAYRE